MLLCVIYQSQYTYLYVIYTLGSELWVTNHHRIAIQDERHPSPKMNWCLICIIYIYIYPCATSCTLDFKMYVLQAPPNQIILSLYSGKPIWLSGCSKLKVVAGQACCRLIKVMPLFTKNITTFGSSGSEELFSSTMLFVGWDSSKCCDLGKWEMG